MRQDRSAGTDEDQKSALDDFDWTESKWNGVKNEGLSNFGAGLHNPRQRCNHAELG